MKLTDLDIIVTAPPAPGWGGRYWILVKLITDTGITGWGECYAASVGPAAMEAVIGDVFERHMAGADPSDVELLFHRVYSSGFTQRPDLTVMGAFSGLEIACWDIVAKPLDMPVHRLMGGRLTDGAPMYRVVPQKPREEMVAEMNDHRRAVIFDHDHLQAIVQFELGDFGRRLNRAGEQRSGKQSGDGDTHKRSFQITFRGKWTLCGKDQALLTRT